MGLPVDSGPYPVPGIIPTSPTISNETPSSVPCTSPKSRAKVDMMQTAFDISSESSDEDQSSSKPLESAPISKSSEVETGPSTSPTSRAGSAAEVIGQQPVVALIEDAVEEPIGTVEDHEDG